MSDIELIFLINSIVLGIGVVGLILLIIKYMKD